MLYNRLWIYTTNIQTDKNGQLTVLLVLKLNTRKGFTVERYEDKFSGKFLQKNITQSVLKPSTGCKGRSSNSGWDEIFRTRPDQTQVSPSHLYSSYRVSFSEVKWQEGRPDHPPPSSSQVMYGQSNIFTSSMCLIGIFSPIARHPSWAHASSLLRFRDHTQTHHTQKESSGRDLYLTTPTLIRERFPCPRGDSNPHSQHASG